VQYLSSFPFLKPPKLNKGKYTRFRWLMALINENCDKPHLKPQKLYLSSLIPEQ